MNQEEAEVTLPVHPGMDSGLESNGGQEWLWGDRAAEVDHVEEGKLRPEGAGGALLTEPS